MDDGSGSSLWQRIAKLFHNNTSVETVIREASEEGELDQEEGSMLLNILNLDELQVQEIMTPRTDIACADSNAHIKDIAALIVASGHSRIPIYKENRDNIIGVVYAKDLLQCFLDETQSALTASQIMREPFFIPETKDVLELLHEFQVRKKHLAILLDEYGGTTGLVSIEDVLEQIVGDIEDEHDAPRENEIAKQADGSYIVIGRAHLEDVAEAFSLHLESEEVDTIGGYLSLLAGRVPKPGESFLIENMCFTVTEANAKQVHTITVTNNTTIPAADSQMNLNSAS